MRAEKKQMVQEVVSLLKGRSAVLISYQGLKANVFNGFRGKIEAECKGDCLVVQNTLIKKAAKELGLTELAEADLNGDTAMLSGADPVSLVKAAKEFAAGAGKEKVNIKMSCVEGQLLGQADTLALADLPSKEVVLAQLLGLIQAPAAGIARALNAGVAKIVYLLSAYEAKQKGESA